MNRACLIERKDERIFAERGVRGDDRKAERKARLRHLLPVRARLGVQRGRRARLSGGERVVEWQSQHTIG